MAIWALFSTVLALIFQFFSSESLMLEKEEKLLHSERIRREVTLEDEETSEIISPCVEDKEYCEFADDYPTNKIKRLLKQQPKFVLEQFHVESQWNGVKPEVEVGADIPELDVRSGSFSLPDIDDCPLCPSTKKIVFPRKARSSEGHFEFIINDDDHRQGVMVDACLPRGADDVCNIPGSLAPGYKSLCVQKYIQRTLVALNSNLTSIEAGSGSLVAKHFEFPSSCACMISMRN
uniref:Spaetzle domain-containing protein n=1 Tax=Graphocephala atropunctata TaxID=36148 RepID=A0A1B6MT71_9HEMI